MTSSHTTKGTKRYRYYICRHAQKQGWQNCPAPSLPAGPIENLVLEHVQRLAAAAAPQEFDFAWQALPPAEQARVLQRLVERVGYDGVQDRVSITFYPGSSTVLAEALSGSAQETNP